MFLEANFTIFFVGIFKAQSMAENINLHNFLSLIVQKANFEPEYLLK
jgi:hypothetical protein